MCCDRPYKVCIFPSWNMSRQYRAKRSSVLEMFTDIVIVRTVVNSIN